MKRSLILYACVQRKEKAQVVNEFHQGRIIWFDSILGTIIGQTLLTEAKLPITRGSFPLETEVKLRLRC